LRQLAVDLNSDIAEGFGRWSLGDDIALLQVIASANVACGFHAGDPSIMRRVCAAAAEAGVGIGAHVGYRDPAGTPDAAAIARVIRRGLLEAGVALRPFA
jgi:5-oxoprolinase (ATP-hydrolysing) subunit A